MPTYVIPQVIVFQDFQTSPQAQVNPMQAHIAGPNAQLIRYAQSTEQAQGLVGVYDPNDDVTVPWPSLPAGAIVDQTYTALFLQNAILRYFDSGDAGIDDLTVVNGYNNRIHSNSFNFVTNGVYPRDESLLDRDVVLGDLVKLRYSNGGGVVATQWTYVNGFLPDTVSAVIDALIDGSSNDANSAAAATYSQISGPRNSVEIKTASAAAYVPYATGKTTEQYTIVVTTSSVNGNLETAVLRVISASGLDDVPSVTPSFRDHPTAIGSLGATATFGRDPTHAEREPFSESAEEEGVSPDDLLVGQRFLLTVTATYTAAAVHANDTAAHSSTPYNGAVDTTYIVTVSRGGEFAGITPPQVIVTTTTGVDVSGPTTVTATNVAYPVGHYGVTIEFTAGLGLSLGDVYYIPVQSKTNGRVGTVVLGNNVPVGVVGADSVEMQLFIKKTVLEINQDRIGYAPLTNFDQNPTQITINSGITAFDPTWTDEGVPQLLPVDSDVGQNYTVVYVQARYWLQTLALEINGINDVGDLATAIPGALDPDNPLAWGVFYALTNSGGSTVLYTAVGGDPTDPDNWDAVLGLLTGYDGAYGLVPLTTDPAVLTLYSAFVDDESSSTANQWCVAWFNLVGVPTAPVVSTTSTVAGYLEPTTTNGNPALALISDNPDAIGTQYTLVTVPAGNAQFIVNGVQPGDILRAFFSTDGFGNTIYQEFIVDVVQSEDQLLLVAGPLTPVTVPSQIEVWRNLDATDEAAAIAKAAGAYGDRRIRAVWPDQVGSGGTLMAGYFMCAALAGLSSGIVPQQGMTNLEITGFDDLSHTTKKFNTTQLNTMAVSGTWIVTQNPLGTVYTRHAVTTGSYSDINEREEMITRNVDSISYAFAAAYAPYIGICNVTPSMQGVLTNVTNAVVKQLSISVNPQLGPQLIDATIVSLAPSLTLADRYVVILDCSVPSPLNNVECHIVI